MYLHIGDGARIVAGGRWGWRSKKKMKRAERREVEVDDDDEVRRIFWKGRTKK